MYHSRPCWMGFIGTSTMSISIGTRSRFVVVLSILWATAVNSLIVLPDGRRIHVIKNNPMLDNVGDFIVGRVEELASAAIEEKGAFSMTIGSGTTVKPLSALAERVDFSKVHIFFGNERTEGDAAGKCYNSGKEVFESLNIPEGNLHRVPELPAEEAAEAYEAEVRNMPTGVVGMKAGLPSFDLCLLGSGADGHCASLYPKSSQVVCSPGNTRAYLAAEGKGGITISIDTINAARNVILSAGKASQSDMARKCLAWSNAATNHNLPAGMISTSEGAVMEWVLSEESAADLPAM